MAHWRGVPTQVPSAQSSAVHNSRHLTTNARGRQPVVRIPLALTHLILGTFPLSGEWRTANSEP